MLRLTGVAGDLWAGPYRVAGLRAWSLATDSKHFADGRWTLTAQVVPIDTFRLAHSRQYDLRLPFGSGVFVWHDVRVEPDGATVTVRGVGPPEAE